MGVMTNFTVRSLRANRVRTLVTVAGVAFACALLCAVLTTFSSLTGFMYTAEETENGAWMAMATGHNDERFALEYADAEASPDVTGTATVYDVGFGKLTPTQEQKLGHYLPLATYTGDVEKLCGVRTSSGRMPEAPGEIVLWDVWRTNQDIELGDTFSIEVGQRRATVPPSDPDASMSMSYDMDAHLASQDNAEEMFGPAIQEVEVGTPLDSSYTYFEPDPDNPFGEELTDTQTRTFTVVGFIDHMPYVLLTDTGVRAFVYEEPAPNTYAEVYMSFRRVESQADVSDLALGLFPESHIDYHSSMLRFMGIRGTSAIWDSFYGVAGVLAIVIIAACVSLIYNAFAISVAERSGQFGLLSSIGASRRQLRRAVIIESFIVAAIGIPLGILIGIGGCAVTFHFLGPAIATLIGNPGLPFATVIDGGVLAIVVVATLVTVSVSALVPALRISRVSPIDAQRNNKGGRVSKKGRKKAARATSVSRLWKRGGFVSRLFGVGGMLARIGQKRGTSKGLAASVSLALAVVLLVTAGSLNVFLGILVGAADSASANYDVGVNAQVRPAGMATRGGEHFNEGILSTLEDAYRAMCESPAAKPVGWALTESVSMVLPADMVDPDYMANRGGSSPFGTRSDGTVAVMGGVLWLDDETFDEYARSVGQDPAVYRGQTPRAIAVNRVYGDYDGKYTILTPFAKTGTAEALTGGTYAGHTIDGFSFYNVVDEDQGHWTDFAPFYIDENDASVDLFEPAPGASLDMATIETCAFEVAYLADEAPELSAWYGESYRFVLPMSALDATWSMADYPIFTAGFNAVDGEHAELAEQVIVRFNEVLGERSGVEVSFVSVHDAVEEVESNHMMALVVNVFCLLFAVILALIALANVFNTVTNSLILRRREFAVMKSVGLSTGQFRRMIADECIGFGMRGLVPGLVIALGVAYALYSMIGLSLEGVEFRLPWSYIGGAIGMVVVAMVLSVAYGMHRCKADDVVAALRADSV